MNNGGYRMKPIQCVVLSLLGLAFPIHAFASVSAPSIYNYDITAKDVFGDIISGSIITNGQAGPLGVNSSTYTDNGILQSYNLTGTGILFGNGTNVSGTVSMVGTGNLVFYSGLGTICELPGGSIGQCDLSGAPNFNQTIFNFPGGNPSAYSNVAFTYWNSYPSSGLPTWTASYSDPNTLTTNQALFTSFTSKEVLPTSVPEPSTWPMMLAGLGLLLPFYRRHRKADHGTDGA
jgi:hypothetical protein